MLSKRGGWRSVRAYLCDTLQTETCLHARRSRSRTARPRAALSMLPSSTERFTTSGISAPRNTAHINIHSHPHPLNPIRVCHAISPARLARVAGFLAPWMRRLPLRSASLVWLITVGMCYCASPCYCGGCAIRRRKCSSPRSFNNASGAHTLRSLVKYFRSIYTSSQPGAEQRQSYTQLATNALPISVTAGQFCIRPQRITREEAMPWHSGMPFRCAGNARIAHTSL